jgi:hypothetical protein
VSARSHATDVYDVRDARLPGNSLIDTIFNRRLMSWSDRGGASMLLGDCWAEHCRVFLDTQVGQTMPIPGGASFTLQLVLRLDDNAEVEREANLNQLENPDFLLVGTDDQGAAVVQAADAKFAADRIKPSQVSVAAVEGLLTIPASGATRALLREALDGLSSGEILVVPGVFLSPASPFTYALLQRAGRGRRDIAVDDIVERIPVDPGGLFDGAVQARLIPTMARLDRLPVSPRENLLAAVYYLRTSCACFHLWDEQTRPYFDAPLEPIAPEPGLVAAEVARRTTQASSAYGLLVAWNRDLRAVMAARKTISDAISLPVGVDEIRAQVGNGVGAQANAEVRRVRGALERAYRDRLLDETGPIYPDDPRSVKQIVKDIRERSRELRPSLLGELAALSRT